MFYKQVKLILETKGWKGNTTPSGLVDMWNGFVEDCESGYNMGIYEYDNDLSVRDSIELILKNVNLRSYADYEEFKQRVYLIDNRFKKLLSHSFFRNDKTNWWSRGILSKARGEYIEDINDFYDIKIQNIDD